MGADFSAKESAFLDIQSFSVLRSATQHSPVGQQSRPDFSLLQLRYR